MVSVPVLDARHNHIGIRPFDPRRDLKQVVGLIEIAFSDIMDPAGQIALERLRRAARWGLWWWWFQPLRGNSVVTPGFVWVENEGIVGNVSLRRAARYGGFFVGNVVVHPDWRGRGIASALMEAALDGVTARKGRWVGLEVRAENEIARHLYERFGFREKGQTLQLLRSGDVPWDGTGSSHPALRRARQGDGADLIVLMRKLIPQPQRLVLELREDYYRPSWKRRLDSWLNGHPEKWWVVEDNGILGGAVRVVREMGKRPDWMEFLIAPEYRGNVEGILVRRGLSSLRPNAGRMVEVTLPGNEEALYNELKEADFRKLRRLVQMRLNLEHRVPLRSR